MIEISSGADFKASEVILHRFIFFCSKFKYSHIIQRDLNKESA